MGQSEFINGCKIALNFGSDIEYKYDMDSTAVGRFS